MEYQKIMLQAVIEGSIFSFPRMCGRKTVLEGFYGFLKSNHGEHKGYEDAEIHIDLKDCIKKSTKTQIIIDEEAFGQEYESVWIKENGIKYLK